MAIELRGKTTDIQTQSDTSGTELASAAVHGTSSSAPEELEKLQRLSAGNPH